MNENSQCPSENLNQVKSVCCNCWKQIDPLQILMRVKALVLSPSSTWEKIKSEELSIKDIYVKYLIPLMIFSSVLSFVGMQVFGIEIPFLGTFRPPFFSAFVGMIFHAVLGLVAVYLSALVISKIAPKFDASSDLNASFKLIAFAYVPVLFAGGLGIVPVLGILTLLVGLYCIYLYFLGTVTMLNVSNDNKFVFTIVSLLGVLVVLVLVGLITYFISPNIAPPEVAPSAQEALESLNPLMEKFADGLNKAAEQAR